ncbi:hypothetical protein QFZ29_002334 [Agromyces albus]|nr:hypothetical protein [Agromyces albus]MDQ0576111.1 hypothetical protein [Agromyces albus]
MTFDIRGESRRVEVAGGAEHPPQRVLHERLGILGEQLGERIRIVELASFRNAKVATSAVRRSGQKPDAARR